MNIKDFYNILVKLISQTFNSAIVISYINLNLGYEKPGDYVGRIVQHTSQLGIRLEDTLDVGIFILV